MAMITMSINDWIDVPDNPRQRDTAKRASTARKRHLAKYQKPHKVVFAASKDGAVLCKLDGHTRAFLWESGDLETPPDGKVEVVLFEVASMHEAKELYDMLDCQTVSKKPSDTIFGACREIGLKLDSSLLKGCSFTTQLKIATSKNMTNVNLYDLVSYWENELRQLDSLDLSSQYTILISCMLVAIKRDGIEKAGEFFKKLQSNSGQKSEKGYDGIELLARTIEIRRAEGRMAGYENLYNICGQTWSAYEMWLKGQVRKNASLPISDFKKIVTSLNTKDQ